jgi:hypothetical protein
MGEKKERIIHIDKNIAIVPISEMEKCGRLDAKHYVSKEHERLCRIKKTKIR